MSAVMPRMTTADTFERKPQPADGSVESHGLDRILRACGIIATARTEPRAQEVLIKADDQDYDFAHIRHIFFDNCRNALVSSSWLAKAASGYATTTKSTAARPFCSCLKVSRSTRFIRLRITALRETLRETASPRRGYPTLFVKATTPIKGWRPRRPVLKACW